MTGKHYGGGTLPAPAWKNGWPQTPGPWRWKYGWASCTGGVCLHLVCFLLSWRAPWRLSRHAEHVYRSAGLRPSGHSVLTHQVEQCDGDGAVAPRATPPSWSRPGGASTPVDESSTAPILDRARKLAGLWVVDDNGQDAYLAWMDFCQDWARHRLKQIYFEAHDFQEEPPRERTNPCCTAQWAWKHGRPPPYRTTNELDRMANDICEEAWDEGRDIRGHLVALIRMLQQRGLLPKWFYSVVAG